MLQGLIDFRNRFRGQIWLEVFVLANITDSDAHTQHLAKIVSQIHPDKVQLNTMARPAPGTNAQPVTRERLAEIAAVLGPIAEIIAQDTQPTKSPHTHATPEDVLDILKRHPCTAKDIAAGLRISVQEAEAHLETLQARDAIVPHAGDNATFYLVK